MPRRGTTPRPRPTSTRPCAIGPDLPQAILLRSMLAAQKQNYGDAIADIQMLLQTDPTNAEYRLQLATFYVGDKRPRKAIELLTLDHRRHRRRKGCRRARRPRPTPCGPRGDALLSVGKHADAIEGL